MLTLIYQNFIRLVFYKMMGVNPQSGKLKSSLLRGHWARSTADKNADEYLRPNFDLGWKQNVAWHDKALGVVRKNGIGWIRELLTQAELDELEDHEILSQLETVYKGCKSRYLREQKATEGVVVNEQHNRRESRKARVRSFSSRVVFQCWSGYLICVY